MIAETIYNLSKMLSPREMERLYGMLNRDREKKPVPDKKYRSAIRIETVEEFREILLATIFSKNGTKSTTSNS